jgi:hypothetical protein
MQQANDQAHRRTKQARAVYAPSHKHEVSAEGLELPSLIGCTKYCLHLIRVSLGLKPDDAGADSGLSQRAVASSSTSTTPSTRIGDATSVTAPGRARIAGSERPRATPHLLYAVDRQRPRPPLRAGRGATRIGPPWLRCGPGPSSATSPAAAAGQARCHPSGPLSRLSSTGRVGLTVDFSTTRSRRAMRHRHNPWA